MAARARRAAALRRQWLRDTCDEGDDEDEDDEDDEEDEDEDEEGGASLDEARRRRRRDDSVMTAAWRIRIRPLIFTTTRERYIFVLASEPLQTPSRPTSASRRREG